MPPEASVLSLADPVHEAVAFKVSGWVGDDDDRNDLLRVEGLSVAVGPQSLPAVRD